MREKGGTTNHLSNSELISRLTNAVRLERRTTAEILELIREIDARRLYLTKGHTSLFAYLTKDLGYSAASAQRRIESARLLSKIPQLKHEISEGKLNLMQTSMLAQGLRHVDKPVNTVDIVEKIKGQDVAQTQIILARELDQPVKSFEFKRLQRDESLRLEITLTKNEQKMFNRLRDLISHARPGIGWKDLFVFAAEEAIAKRELKLRRAATSKMEAAVGQLSIRDGGRAAVGPGARPPRQRLNKRPSIPASIRRIVTDRDKCCQWRDPKTGLKCGSTFQLQIDHIKSVWNGGSDAHDNLQLLCAAHNRWKFRREEARLP